jgi:hypothetical protein
MRSLTLATLLTAALLAAGCYGSVGYAGTASSDGYGPDLVYAAPGVQVIADFDEPIFFADSFYWRFSAGGWYRSPQYSGGWVYATPPVAVMRIDRPQAYVHYRPAGWVGHRQRGPQQTYARERRDDGQRFQPGRGGPAPTPPTYQPPPPRAAPPPPPAAPPGQRGRDRRDDRGHQDDRGHGDDRGHRDDHDGHRDDHHGR